jgi:Tol biopolymer transport system component
MTLRFNRILSFAFTLCAIVAAPGFAATAATKVTTPAKGVKQYTIEQFFSTKRITGGSFSADEKRILFSSDESGIFNAYTVSVSGGKAEALTTSTKDSTFAVSYFPNDDRILFTRDSGGDENNHLFVRELDGTERDLTPGTKIKASFGGWKPDGSAFYVITNERDAKFFDVYRYDAKHYERTMFYRNEKGLNLASISRDEKWIALNKQNTTIDSDVFLHDVAKNETKHITSHSGSVKYKAQTFDPASRRLLFTTDEGSEFERIKAYDLVSGVATEFEKANWDIDLTYYSRDGRFRVTIINDDGSTSVKVVEIQGDTERPFAMPKLPGGMILGLTFSKSGTKGRSDQVGFFDDESSVVRGCWLLAFVARMEGYFEGFSPLLFRIYPIAKTPLPSVRIKWCRARYRFASPQATKNRCAFFDRPR